MRLFSICLIAAFAITTVSVLGSAQRSNAEVYNQGPKVCSECHRSEAEVWKGTKHFQSFKKIHKSKKAKAIAKATGEKSMKRNETCVQCHYTVTQKRQAAKQSQLRDHPAKAAMVLHPNGSRSTTIMVAQAANGTRKHRSTRQNESPRHPQPVCAGRLTNLVSQRTAWSVMA